jgi:hypothetical protein
MSRVGESHDAQAADRVFAPYATYREEAAKASRTIPIVQLTAREPDASA